MKLQTEEINDESAIGEAASGVVEESLAIGQVSVVRRLPVEGEGVVASVGDGVAKADDGGVAS